MNIRTLINWQVFVIIYLLSLHGVLTVDKPPEDLINIQLNKLPEEIIEIEETIHVADGFETDYDDFYDFDVIDIDGDHVSLDNYRGMVSLVVNVASECGYTDGHYRSLVRLQNVLGQHNKFTVLAFPCNQFGSQEPGSRKDIKSFTSNTYHVNFPVFDKINVHPPDVVEPWDFLIKSSGMAPNWNFWKYLVDENGKVLNAWGPQTSVEDIALEVRTAVNKISLHAYDEL